MKKIKLVYIRGAEIGTRKMQSYPLGIICMREYAYSFREIRENIKIEIDDIRYDIQDETYIYEIYKENYDMILFSCYIWNMSRALDIARKIKLINPSIIIGFGGPEVDDAESILYDNNFIDIISIGEGEKAFVSLVNYFLLNKNNEVLGIVYRNEKNEIITAKQNEIINNLDEIPSIVNNELVKKSDMLLYETSRGCPFQCKYCCWAGKSMRYYSLERVESDLRILLSEEVGNSLFLIDSELDIDIERAKKIMEIIIKYNIHNKIIQGFLGFHVIDEELIKLCKEANFKFGIGIQSINKETIEKNGRTWFDVEKFEQKLKIIKKYYKISEIEFQLIMGLPGDNYESFKKNLKWCDNMGATHISVNRLYVLPGSYLYKHAEEYKLVYDKKPYHLVYSNYSYTYNDIMKSEAFFVAFQISKSVFGVNKEIIFDNKKLNVWTFIEGLAEIIKEKRMYSQGRQESQIIEKEYDYESIMNENLRTMGFNSEKIKNYIKIKFINKKANRYFLHDRVKVEGHIYAKINKYFISPYVEMKENTIIKTGDSSVVILHNFENNKIKKIRINNQYIKKVEEVLEELKGGILIKDINKYVDDDYKMVFLKKIIKDKLYYKTDKI